LPRAPGPPVSSVAIHLSALGLYCPPVKVLSTHVGSVVQPPHTINVLPVQA
jgi:hypothetical protein